ncbi:alpha-hydroxy acid oxidase [Streptomyces sp. NPDC014728]|uniref:alpha-hydroxy acid oxidase n=1 Tax=unclassified Streptomyces TaxID=2593676 RepID=UPI0036F993A5
MAHPRTGLRLLPVPPCPRAGQLSVGSALPGAGRHRRVPAAATRSRRRTDRSRGHQNRVYTRPAFHPEDVELLRSWTDLPIAVKGVCHPDEAARLCDAGAAALVVSNHGGRQLDSGPAALDCLPGVIEAVAGRIPVLFDSGIRTGTDVLIALALGASAVMIGRPWLYGLAVGGQAGVEHILRCLQAEFTAALKLTGHHRPDTLSPADLTPLAVPLTRRP